MSNLKDENGKPLEIKEGIVLDRDGHVVSSSDSTNNTDSNWKHGPFHTQAKIKYFRLNPFTGLLFLLAIPLLFTAGLTIAAIVAAVAIVFWLMNRLVRLFLS